MNVEQIAQQIRQAPTLAASAAIIERFARSPATQRPKLKRPDAAQYMGISTSTLEKFACTGGGPQFIKLGKTVLYDPSDLDSWLEARKVSSTSEADARRAAGR
ncbi:MAG: helix-turn-helix domain-containing protein [Magnetococcales bacterium]|nr:helix-turn-helix domain-containing protein [Magnetococcales bacterium]